MRIFVVIGTRPEAIKMLPLAMELKKSKHFDTKICFSGQHRELARSVFEEFNIKADFVFDEIKKGRTLKEMTVHFIECFDRLFDKEKPELVLVHGDTATAFCGALASFYRGIDVAHIEAGLRSFDRLSPYPEEFMRVAIDALSGVHFAPTELSAENLRREGRQSVYTVGNTVIDALEYSLKKKCDLPILREVGKRKLVLITTHRRENIGKRMKSSLAGIRDILIKREDFFGIIPAHPNPEVQIAVRDAFDGVKNIKICEPFGVVEFHHLMKHAYAIFTDSGGIQEESAYLGIPVFLLRENTERAECIASGNVRLVGCNGERIKEAFFAFLDDGNLQSRMRTPSVIFGDGHASERIVNCLTSIMID